MVRKSVRRGDAGAEDRPAASHSPYGAEHADLVVVLQDVAPRAGAHSGEDRGVVLKHGDHQDAGARVLTEDTPPTLVPDGSYGASEARGEG